MASTQNSTEYDSDQESIDLDNLPMLGSNTDINNTRKTPQSPSMGISSLLDDERAEVERDERMQEIAKEIELFTLEKNDEPEMPFMNPQETLAEVHPPPVSFFTAEHHHIYLQDTLIWPFKNSNLEFSKLTPDTVKMRIMDGYFQRLYKSKKEPKLIIQYLFHVMSVTKDMSLMHASFATLMYIININVFNFNFYQDILLALSNLGGDLSKLGIDTSTLSSPVIQNNKDSEKQLDKPRGTFKENKILILKFLSSHLDKNRRYSPSTLDQILKIILAIGLDPLILDSSCLNHVANGINQVLKSYPNNKVFLERALNLVRHITVYSDFHHHTVAYVCSNYILPTNKYGQMLRSAAAYLQLEFSLHKEHQESILLYVLVEDVFNLVLEREEVFGQSESSTLFWVMNLLDICISDDPLPSEQKAHLQNLCNVIEPLIMRRKVNIDDQNIFYLNHFTTSLMIKWKQKAGAVKRQQTLMELKGNYISSPQANCTTAVGTIETNYSSSIS